MGDYFTDVFLKELKEKLNDSPLRTKCESLVKRKDILPLAEKYDLQPFDFFFLHDHIHRVGYYEEQATDTFENKDLIEWYFENIGKTNNSVTPDLAIEFGLKVKRILGQNKSNDALHLKISPIQGDVMQLAPEVSDACVLWLRSGFNGRYHIWQRIHDQCNIPVDNQPWRNSEDAVIPVNMGSLRYIYIFSNPNDAKGVASVSALKKSISTALDRLTELGCRKPSFIHIPLYSKEKDQEAAETLIKTLREWNQQTPEAIDEVYLVDRKGDFASYIN